MQNSSSSSFPSPMITSSDQITYFLKKNLNVNSIFGKSFVKLFHDLFQQQTNELKSDSFTVKKPRKHKNTNRKQSEYILFCRYMKKHSPDQKNLQHVWKNTPNADWLKMKEELLNPTNSPPLPKIIEDSPPPQCFKLQFTKVMKELMQQYEDDHFQTLMNIKLSKTS